MVSENNMQPILSPNIDKVFPNQIKTAQINRKNLTDVCLINIRNFPSLMISLRI